MDKTIGFIDVGTNSVHMLVVRFYEGSLGTSVYSDKESVRIGQSLYSRGVIDEETIDKARIVISKFAEVAKGFGAEQVVAMATAAAREASNRADLVQAVKGCGVDLRIIPGMEEARLIRLGVLGPDAPVRTLCIDVGGGSTEIALAEGRDDLYLDSLSLGAIRLAYGSGIDQKGRVTFRQYDVLRRMVDTASYRSVGKIRELGFEKVVGSSGTIVALAEICAARRGDGDPSYLTYSELESLMRDMCATDVEGRLKFPKMSANRADIIVGGGAVVEELMYLLGIEVMEVSRNGLREGGSSVRTLAARCGCDRKHSDAVMRYALSIYDALVKAGVMGTGPHWRELLGYAAELHDVGEFISYEKHNVHSYTIIRNSYLAGFDDDELQAMALMARFHHNSIPGPSSKYFLDFDGNETAAIRRCALILKIADILDRGRDSSVDRIEIAIFDGTVSLRLIASKDISMQLWKLKSIKDEFSNVYGRKLRIEHLQRTSS